MIEQVAHIRIEDRGYNVYISICYDTMTLHAYKYDDQGINYNWFNSLQEFNLWVQTPIQYN